MAKVAKDKAGDNQALLTLAKTMQDDHQANEDAVTALSQQEERQDRRDLCHDRREEKTWKTQSGGQFNDALLTEAIEGHAQALRYFEAESAKFRGDPDVYLYVQETIPVVRAHLEMARAMKKQIGPEFQAKS